MEVKIKNQGTLYKEILTAAKELFSHFGFRKTTIDDIAKKARVAKGTVYNYFQNKEELFKKVLRKESANIISFMKEAVKVNNDPERKIRDMIIAKIKIYKELCSLYELNVDRVDEILFLVKEEYNEINRMEIKIIEDILDKDIKNSSSNLKNISDIAKVLATSIKGFEIRWTIETDLKTAMEELDYLIKILFFGIKNSF